MIISPPTKIEICAQKYRGTCQNLKWHYPKIPFATPKILFIQRINSNQSRFGNLLFKNKIKIINFC